MIHTSTSGVNLANTSSDQISNAGTIKKKPRFLCLHGWRTSAQILTIQTSAFRFHTKIDAAFVDAPFLTTCEPDAGIKTFYPDMPYYEWIRSKPGCFKFDSSDRDMAHDMEESINKVISFANENGPFDGIMGFSQGASMATKIVQLMEEKRGLGLRLFENSDIKCVILIGGVTALNSTNDNVNVISLPNLHIQGAEDPYFSSGKRLEAFYAAGTKLVMVHEEGHNIPSIRTELYPAIGNWIYRTVYPIEAEIPAATYCV